MREPIANPTIASMPIGFIGAVKGNMIAGRERGFGAVHTGVSPNRKHACSTKFVSS
jgi:hypothetical protein